MINKYFNHLNRASEANLFEDLTIEYIQINGFDVLYIPRTNLEVDDVLGEPTQSTFDSAYQIEVFDAATGQLGGDQALMSKFGFKLSQTTELIMSKRRFAELGTGFIRPQEGDLIYIGDPKKSLGSFINNFFEINQVWYNDPEWQFGREFTYRLVCETFVYSYEKIQTGIREIDVGRTSEDEQIMTGINNTTRAKKPNLVIDKGNPFADF